MTRTLMGVMYLYIVVSHKATALLLSAFYGVYPLHHLYQDGLARFDVLSYSFLLGTADR